ncbi:hypothetical protein THICB2_640191 [Thiomonas sp. CB2]|nr:hypothetical protein THICB2_640191 [Thiomonas sp. CB2]CQR41876.1 hypothetical protein THICB3110445 [Thiomonas sp. CB3]
MLHLAKPLRPQCLQSVRLAQSLAPNPGLAQTLLVLSVGSARQSVTCRAKKNSRHFERP